MDLLLRRHHQIVHAKLAYNLDVQLLCDAEERRVIRQHALLDVFLFADPDRDLTQQRASHVWERAQSRNVFVGRSAYAFYADVCLSALQWLRSKTYFVVTVRRALGGTTITCTNLEELLSCEEQIRHRFDEIARIVVDALAFELGQENLYAPDTDDQDDLPVPAALANPNRGY